jgi:hypothetical protein
MDLEDAISAGNRTVSWKEQATLFMKWYILKAEAG